MKLDYSKKKVGDIGICLYWRYSGVEVEVVERCTEADHGTFDPEDCVWIKRTDGYIFEDEVRGSRHNRLDLKEVIFNEHWIEVKPDWDGENNE